MAVTQTPRLKLQKQDSGDASWHSPLNAGMDNADLRLLTDAAGSPVGVAEGFYVGHLYYQTDISPPRVWICTVVGAPGTWIELSQLALGAAAVQAAIVLNNTIALRGKESGGTARDLAQVDASDRVLFGTTALATMRLQAATLAGVKAWDGVTERDVLGYPKGYLNGLRISLAADTDHDLTFSIHDGRNFQDDGNYFFTPALTKQIDAVWAAGDNAGGMPAGLLAANTTYFAYVISGASGSPIDAGYDTSATATNLLAAAGGSFTKYREVGRLRTDAVSNIRSWSYYNASGQLEFELVPQTWANSAVNNVAHGLGVIPRSWSIALRNAAGEGGFAIGDEFKVDGMYDDATVLGYNTWASPTEFAFPTFGTVRGILKGGGGTFNLTPSSWRVVYRGVI